MSNFDLESEQAFAMCHENHRRAAQRQAVLCLFPALIAAAPVPLGSAEPEDEPLEVYADCEDVTVDDCADWPTVEAQPSAANPAILLILGAQLLAVAAGTVGVASYLGLPGGWIAAAVGAMALALGCSLAGRR